LMLIRRHASCEKIGVLLWIAGWPYQNYV